MEEQFKVLDLTLTEEEGGDYPVFSGTQKECQEFLADQGMGIGYKVVPVGTKNPQNEPDFYPELYAQEILKRMSRIPCGSGDGDTE